MYSISLLGPVEVRRDGEFVALPAGKTTELLIRLALDAGVTVRAERLIEDLWGESDSTEKNTLHSKISMLRRALGDSAAVTGGRNGYTLNVDPSSVDAIEVQRVASIANDWSTRGEHRAAVDACGRALEMFRGDILSDAGDGDWVIPHRARVDAARLRLLETGCSARLRLGDTNDVIGDLELAVAVYPYHESLWVLLITALYQTGRQADALETYHRVRRQLADDLGLDPGPQLQQLEQQILNHDTTIEPTSRTTTLVTGNLPPIASELIGRDDELASVVELVALNRLVEIVGPGGIGKTALALAIGRTSTASPSARRGGVWLARLETAVTAADVIDTLIAAANVTGGETALYERFKGSDALIIFDNCEHVIEATAELTVRLLDASPGIHILCTSQVALGVDGETVFELTPLDLVDAAELFTRRATAQRRSQRLAADHDAVLELCRSLDGLPLAIELAAARTKTLSVEDITRRLDDRFNVLNDPTSRRPERRRALKATIRWSYELLFPDDQRGLWALATFAGGAPLGGIESVLATLGVPSAAAIDVVSRLASRSLVIVDHDTSGQVRYRLLDSVRAFALEALADNDMTDAALAAHATWFAAAARSSTPGVRSRDQAEHLTFARTERANIDAALAWTMVHDPLLALDIATGFGWAWVVLGDSRAAQRLLAALDSAGTGAPLVQRTTALLLAGWVEASTGNLSLARGHITEATEIADAIGDVALQARCSYYLAYVESHDGGFRHALELTDRARTLYAGLDRTWDQAANGLFAARAAISAGDEERSVEASANVEHWLRQVDDPWLHARADGMRGELARLQHRFDDAVIHCGRAVETSHRLGFLQAEAYQTGNLGRAYCQAGDYDIGANTLELAVDKAEATGDTRMATLARVHLGRVLRALGRIQPARIALEAAAAWHRTAGGGEQAALGDCLLAAIDAADHIAGAEERLHAILDEARAADAAHVEVFALDALARLAAQREDMDTAGALFELADGRMEHASHFITARDRIDAYAVRQSG